MLTYEKKRFVVFCVMNDEYCTKVRVTEVDLNRPAGVTKSNL